MKIKDSGTRREFDSGAVRDCADGKGRCDLLPLDIIADLIDDNVFEYINDYIRLGKIAALRHAIIIFALRRYESLETALLEVSKHFEEGAKKYDERNWEKGINSHCYIDSAIRHYLKHVRGDDDEPHDRAFLWNLLCAWWTHINKPGMIDLPFNMAKADTAPHIGNEKCEHKVWFGDINAYECDKFGKVCDNPEECLNRGDYE